MFLCYGLTTNKLVCGSICSDSRISQTLCMYIWYLWAAAVCFHVYRPIPE